ncbi:MAG: flavin reductase family protein [Acholeplasmatales bacterium]|nr:flavin reductase family protein [Acholeplasmatales bacterium]
MRQNWKGGNMVYPLPAVLVTSAYEGKKNAFTVGWCATVCTNPPMLSISIRKSRYSYDIIKQSKEFVVNLTTEELVEKMDYCGVTSGRDVDKFKKCDFHENILPNMTAPGILESPVNISCKVNQIIELGSHDLFIADVIGVNIDDNYLDENGKFDLSKAHLVAYNHGEYYGLGDYLGKFGYSIRKKNENDKSGITKQSK